MWVGNMRMGNMVVVFALRGPVFGRECYPAHRAHCLPLASLSHHFLSPLPHLLSTSTYLLPLPQPSSLQTLQKNSRRTPLRSSSGLCSTHTSSKHSCGSYCSSSQSPDVSAADAEKGISSLSLVGPGSFLSFFRTMFFRSFFLGTLEVVRDPRRDKCSARTYLPLYTNTTHHVIHPKVPVSCCVIIFH